MLLNCAHACGETAIGTVLGDNVLRCGCRWLSHRQLRQDVRLNVWSTECSWKVGRVRDGVFFFFLFIYYWLDNDKITRISFVHLVYYSIRRQDDGNAAIANTNTSKLGAVVCWCPDVYSARPISHVFPSLGFPDLRWFPSTPGSDPVCLSTKDQDHEMENKFLSGNKSTKGGISKSRRNELERKWSNKTERGYIIIEK